MVVTYFSYVGKAVGRNIAMFLPIQDNSPKC